MKRLFPVLNIRKGFACNSSSSHSVVCLRNSARPQDTHDGGTAFGWEDFTLSAPESKRQYFEQLGRETLSRHFGQKPHLLAGALAAAGITANPEGYVDHQSVFYLPLNFEKTGLHTGFFQALLDRVAEDDIVVLGGNDNSEGHPLSGHHPDACIPAQPSWLKRSRDLRLDRMEAYVARDDKSHWTLFAGRNGTKLRLAKTLDAPPQSYSSVTPELVDVKVTDFCAYDCAYCYQGSTTAGKHAPLPRLLELMGELAKNQVFEVAFGGGEPTRHPQFQELLRATAALGITPNFTTRNIAWLRLHAASLREVCGAVAVSVDSVEGAKALAGLAKELNASAHYIALQAQVVDGSVSTETLREILRLLAPHRIKTLILGWKTTGRGASVKPLPMDWAFAAEADDETNEATLLCDTAFLQKYWAELRELHADPKTLSPVEGAFSCYIDAVTMRMAPSSYCAEDRYHPLCQDTLSADFSKAWDTIRAQGELELLQFYEKNGVMP